jgi:hypothetical protein
MKKILGSENAESADAWHPGARPSLSHQVAKGLTNAK